MCIMSSGIAVLILVFFGTFVPITGVMAESAPPIAWISQFGTGSGTSALGVAIDGSDSVYVVGDTFGALPGQTSAGDYDAFLCKFDILGNVLWSNQYGSSEGDIARGVAVDPSGNIIVSGDTDTALFGQISSGGDDAYIRKYDNYGNVLWTHQFGSSMDDWGYSVAVDASGDAYIVGFTDGTLPGQTSTGGSDAYIRKYDSSGNVLWTQQFGSGLGTTAYGVAVDASGNAFVVGDTFGALPGQISSGRDDAFICKFDSSGNLLWTQQFGTGGNDLAQGVAVDASGDALVVGYTSGIFPGQTYYGGQDAFVCKFNGSGDNLWTTQFGSNNDDTAQSLSVDTSGNAFVVGYTDGTFPGQTSSGGQDSFVCKFDSSGNEVWTNQYGTPNSDSANGVTVDASGTPFVVGYSGSNAYLANIVTNSSKLAFITSTQTVTAGSTSGQITFQVQNMSGNPVNVTNNTNVSLFSSSINGRFDTNATGLFNGSITQVTIPAGSNQASVYYKDITAGNPTITAINISYASGAQQENVNPAAASQIRVETAANGSGGVTPAQNVTAGASVTVYAVTRDQYGNYLANTAGTWSLVNSTGGVVGGDLVPASDNKNAVFTGHLVGTTVIQVTSGSLTSTNSGMLTVITGSTTKLNISGFTSPYTAGTASNFTVTAQDASGNTITSYIGTVHFSSSDPQAVLPANYTFVSGDNGTHTFSATLKTAGSQSITATDTVTSSITGSQSNITINPAAASQIRVETAANGSGGVTPAQNVTAGASVTVYAVTRDQYGNYLANTAGTWSLVNSTGGVVGGDLVPASDNKSAVFTGHLVGTTVIQVTSGSLTSTNSGMLTVITGSTTKLNISGFTSPYTAGTASNFTVTAQDASGNTITSYIGTVHFSSSDPQAVLPANYTFVSGDNGTHTFSATLKTAGSQSITATDTVTSSITGSQSNITINPAAASQIRVETAANGSGGVTPAQNVTAGASVTVYAVTRDQYGNYLANTAGTWSLVNSTGGVVGGDLVPASDNKNAVFTGHLVGTTVIQVTSGSLTSTNSGMLTVITGSTTKLNISGFTSPYTAGTASNFTVTAQDASGNTITSYIGTVHFSSSDPQAVLPANYTFVSGDNGTHTFSATLKTAGSQSITATDTVTSSITGSQSNITINPAAASQIRVETAANGSGGVTPAQNVTAGASVTVYAVTRDQYGNYLANTAGTWSLVNSTGGVVGGDLVPASDNKSAVFTGHLVGTTVIQVTSGSLTSTNSGMLTVITPVSSGGGSGGGGGGGSGGGTSTTTSGVTNVTTYVNAQGVFNQMISIWSDDYEGVVTIPSNTTGLTAGGAPLTQISFIHVTTTPAFQTGAGMIGQAYDITPNGITFNPAVSLQITYNPASIPTSIDPNSLQIAYYDTTQNAWVTIPSTVDTAHNYILAQISHFTIYAVTYGVKVITPASTTTTTTTITLPPVVTTTPLTTATTTTTPIVTTTTAIQTTTTTTPPVTTTKPITTSVPATFEASALSINPSTVKPDENVTVNLRLTNTSNVTGTDTVTLQINNNTIGSQTITLDGGTSTVVTFTTSGIADGKYTVQVAGLKGNFIVSKIINPTLFWAGAIGVFLLGLTLAVIMILLRKTKK